MTAQHKVAYTKEQRACQTDHYVFIAATRYVNYEYIAVDSLHILCQLDHTLCVQCVEIFGENTTLTEYKPYSWEMKSHGICSL